MCNIQASIRWLLLSAFIGATFGYGTHFLFSTRTDEHEKIQALEATVARLKSELLEKNSQFSSLDSTQRHNAQVDPPNSTTQTEMLNHPSNEVSATGNGDSRLSEVPSSLAILKDLETVSDNDPRSFADKLKELLTDNSNADKYAIASRGILDMALNRENLPDYALQAIYYQQTGDDLKRVIAQVLSQRGNHLLLDSQISEAHALLKSDQAVDRQSALNQLARTRSARAADSIVPYLQDLDVNVRLDALQALRDTGNQKHTAIIEPLINDADPAVSALANDVLNQLRNLSSTARSTVSKKDIEATLPPLLNP